MKMDQVALSIKVAYNLKPQYDSPLWASAPDSKIRPCNNMFRVFGKSAETIFMRAGS